MATYKQLQQTTKRFYGFVPKTCWIAHIKDDYGLTTRVAHNRVRHQRKHPCPSEKRAALEDVMQALGLCARTRECSPDVSGSREIDATGS